MNAACARDPAAVAAHFVTSGDAHVAQLRFKEASIQYANAIKARPEWAEPVYKRAQALRSIGESRQARDLYARAAALDPSNADANLQAGRLALDAGDLDAARAYGELALEADPRLAAAHVLVASALASLGRAPEARRHMDAALRLDAASASTWVAKAVVESTAGDVGAASESFIRAVALAPQSPDVRVALAAFHLSRGDGDTAERTLREAVALDPDHEAAQRALVQLYLAAGKPDRAEAPLKRLAERSNRDRLALADYYLRTNRPKDALGPLADVTNTGSRREARAAKLRLALAEYGANPTPAQREALETSLRERIADEPGALEAYEFLAHLYIATNRLDAALRQYEALASRVAAPAGAYTMMGLLQSARGDRTAARTAYQRALAADPDAAIAANNLAWIESEDGDLDEGLRLALRARAGLEGRPEVEDTLGSIYLRKDWPTRAIEAFMRATAIAPRNALYRYHLARARIQAGNSVAGRADMRLALTLGLAGDDAKAATACLKEDSP